MRVSVAKDFTFHAAHFDALAPKGDQCRRLHGHTYKVTVEVVGTLDEARGMFLHGNVIKNFYRDCVEPYVEHQLLNETLTPLNPTMEAVCKWIAEQAIPYFNDETEALRYVAVKLWETPTMSAEILLNSKGQAL